MPLTAPFDRNTALSKVSFHSLEANRALAPSSKLQVEDWVARQVVIPGLPQVAVQHLCRAMDFLLATGEKLQREVFFRVAHLLNFPPL